MGIRFPRKVHAGPEWQIQTNIFEQLQKLLFLRGVNERAKYNANGRFQTIFLTGETFTVVSNLYNSFSIFNPTNPNISILHSSFWGYPYTNPTSCCCMKLKDEQKETLILMWLIFVAILGLFVTTFLYQSVIR